MLRDGPLQAEIQRGVIGDNPLPGADKSGKLPPFYWAAFQLSGDWR